MFIRSKKVRRNFLTYIILIGGLFVVLFPFIWNVLSAFKIDKDIYTYPPKWFPSQWSLENFFKVFKMVPFGRYYLNSIFVSTITTLGQILISLLAAYPLARLDFPFKNLIFILILSTLMMPFVVTLIPTFLIIRSLGWIDTYQGLIVPFLFNAFSIFFLRQFFITIPKDLEDAAHIDGCGYLGILLHVMIPNSKPAIATISLFAFLSEWGQYMWPLVVTNSTNMRTLPIGLKYLISEGGGEYNLLAAASLMAIIPILLVYIFSEKQFIKSVTLTGIK